MISQRRAAALVVALVLALLLAGCSSSGSSKHSTSASASSSGSVSPSGSASSSASVTFPPAPGAPAHQFYVSIGDSYAAGYQPTGPRTGAMTRDGFAYQIVSLAKAKGYDYSLVNFGCGGATTDSVLHAPGCAARNLGSGAASYAPKTQAAAAEAFLAAHRGQVGLVTVSIGGNDINKCGQAANAVGCLGAVLGTVQANLKTLLAGLRQAAGPQTRIVGSTYPDVLLGNLLSKDAARQGTAKLSVYAFESLINPELKQAYEAVGGKFVDVTAATGGYGPLTVKTTLPPYGSIPVPVAKICQLTYYCQFHDIHPRTPGYALIAALVVATLPHH